MKTAATLPASIEQIGDHRAGNSGDAQQGQWRKDRGKLASEIAPGVGTDDLGRVAVDGAAQRLLQAPDPGSEQKAGKPDRKEGGLPWREAERGACRVRETSASHSASTKPPMGSAMPPPMYSPLE